ncbi:MAG: hypothetical protein CMP91_07425 [Gammaproteobacteria bacterium]|nr:hypothetical protein [Gammaproteobacteria bacterium]|tara:strand:+ start:394431 stop:394967 length:537 start_codon:yes stop_codon:yes gene_type:complete
MSNKIKAFLIGIGFISIFSTPAFGQYYFGGEVGFLEYSEDGFSQEPSLTALAGVLGMDFNENFSGEIRVGFGIGDDTITAGGISADIELDNYFGAYLKGGIPVSEQFFPYVTIGYTRGELSASAFGLSISESESDVSFGIGFDYDFTSSISGSVEYMNYLDKDGAEISGFSIGITRAF